MKKKMIYILTLTFLISILIPITVSADMGPKPSVRIAFKGLGNEICYGTLLSKTESTGPAFAWDGTEENALYNKNDGYTDISRNTIFGKPLLIIKTPTDIIFFRQCGALTKQRNWLGPTIHHPNLKSFFTFPKATSMPSAVYITVTPSTATSPSTWKII